MKIFPNIYRLLLAVCCLLPSAIFAQSTEALPQGLWKVEQITIEKNTDGKLETTVYNTAAEVQGYIPCPKEWEIKDAKTIVLRYADGMETIIEYSLNGNRFTIAVLGAILQYEYSINEEKLTLVTTHSYAWSQSSGVIARIEEKWAIVLIK